MSFSTCSFSGFVFVFVIVISSKCVDGCVWVADDLGLCLGEGGSGDRGGEGNGGGGGGKYCADELNAGGGGGENCGGGMKLLNVGGDGGVRGQPTVVIIAAFIKLITVIS